MRKLAGPAITLLVGSGLTILGWTNGWIGGGLLVLAVVWGCVVFTPLSNHLPSIELVRGAKSEGVTLRLRPPEGGVRRRLRERTERVTEQMYEYLRSQPATWSTLVSQHRATSRRMQAADTEEERDAIWAEESSRVIEQFHRERQELAQRFGSDVRYLLAEYQRLGLIDPSEAGRIEWMCQSDGWLHEAASELGALARRL